jgi:hypothetical protein
MNGNPYGPDVEAFAETWASMDGELDKFREGRTGKDEDGTYEGYTADTREFLKRLSARGYVLVLK